MINPTNIKRVIRIAFEGQAGNRSAFYNKSAYWKFLMDTYGDSQNFHGFSGTSLPSYIQATAGTNNGITGDSFTQCSMKIPNIYDVLTANGMTYENYEESGNQGNHRHTPGYFYPSTCKGVQDLSIFMQKYVNGTQTPAASLIWITPNLCNCCHDCPDPNTCGNWLKNNLKLDTIFQKPWFTDGSTLIMLVEDDGGSGSENAVCVFCSIESKGLKSTIHYDHISELSTVMWLLGIPNSIGSANASKAMKDLFSQVPPPPQKLTVSLSISPNPVEVNKQTTSTAVVMGGMAPYHYTWAGFPSPCVGADTNTITCSPNQTGDFNVQVTVTDSSSPVQTATDTKTLTVSPTPPAPVLASIVVSPAIASVNVNNTIQLSAICKDQNGNTMMCPTLAYSSDNMSIATVSSAGLVTGVSTGTANVTASSNSIVSNPSVITVSPIPPPTEKKFKVYDVIEGASKIGVQVQQNDSAQYTKTQACQEVLNRLLAMGSTQVFTVFDIFWSGTTTLRGVTVIVGGKDKLPASQAALKACNVMGKI